MSQPDEAIDGLLDPAAAHLKAEEDVGAESGPTGNPRDEVLSADQLLEKPTEELDLDSISNALRGHTADERARICLLLLSRDIEDARLAQGLTQLALHDRQDELDDFLAQISRTLGEGLPEGAVAEVRAAIPETRRISMDRLIQLRTMEEKLDAWFVIFPPPGRAGPTTDDVGPCMVPVSESGIQWKGEEGIVEVEADDPWADAEGNEEIDDPWNDDASDPGPSTVTARAGAPADVGGTAEHAVERVSPGTGPSEVDSPVPLYMFMQQPISRTAIDFASSGFIPGLAIIRARYGAELYPYRLEILAALPEWVAVNDLSPAQLLPTLGEKGIENVWTGEQTGNFAGLDSLFQPDGAAEADSPSLTNPEPMSLSGIESWYRDQILSLDSSGQVDVQLAWMQEAESHGITGLADLGEDLSLLSRLVYESGLTAEQNEKWNIESWQGAAPAQIIAAYLTNAAADSIISDIRTRVMPYLYVLESRAERSGRSDNSLVERHLSETVLALPLNLALPIFENSKATLGKSERIIKDDMTVARLALACLYGSDQREVWGIMSSIFECLPVWELSGRDPEDDAELTSTTLDSIANFIRPTASQPRPPQPTDLMMFFKPLPFASLSRALDILDVHLESGEILARWDVPVQLRFLLQSSRDSKEQIELAERMVRTAASSGVRAGLRSAEKLRPDAGGGDEGKWARLWDDMLRLNGSGDQLLRGAFGMVDGGEIMRVYLGGLLRSGKLEMARKTVRRLENDHDLKPETLEAVVLATSRELYEGAETGNIHTGDMKVAYDCLGVAPPTPAIQTERSFIEATSRLSTFSLPSFSPHGGSLTPQEIRHTKNRLDLLASVLSHSADAFRHEEMLIDLANKLGLSSRTQHGRLWGMMAKRAASASEWEMGDEYTVKAAEVVREAERRKASGQAARDRKKASDPGAESSEFARLKEDVWQTALSVGGAADYSDISRKLDLLGLAVELCPALQVGTVLEAWRKVEDGRIKLDAAAKRRRIERIPGSRNENMKGHRRGGWASSSAAWASPKFDLPEGLPTAEERVLGSRTAARAARMAYDIGGRLGSRLPPIAMPIQLPNLPRPASPAASIGAALSRTDSRNSQRGREAQQGPQENRGRFSFGAGAGRDSNRSDSIDRAGEKRFSGEYTRALDAIARFGGGSEGDAARDRDGSQLGMDDVERVKRGASRALRQGVGWLLGADEREQG